MSNMSGFDGLFVSIGNLYFLLAVTCAGVALWQGKTVARKVLHALLVLVFFIAPIAPDIYRRIEYRSKLSTAQVLFDERCRTSGEKIYKKVDNEEGILLLNIRQGDIAQNRANSEWEGAALPNDATGLGYIENFLVWEHNDGKNHRGYLNNSPEKATAAGFQFVDVKQKDGSLLRFRLKRAGSSELITEPARGEPARYAVGFTTSEHPEDRKHWVAGVTIIVSDTKTGEILGKRTSYSLEPGLGSTTGGRSPWGFAITCPSVKGWDGARTRFFVDRVVQPTQVK